MSTDPFQGVEIPDDPFDIPEELNVTEEKVQEVHVRIQQRNGRKCLTTVQGLPPKLNLKKVLTYFKKQFCCNGTIVEDPAAGKILQMQGDQRQQVAEFLVQEKICHKEQIKIHGIL